LSKPIDVSKFDVIYAGAQKNMGPAGSAVSIINKEVLGKTGRDIPNYLNYQTHISKGSAFNTWPVLAIYAVMLNLQWLNNLGGVPEITKRNRYKAELLYSDIEQKGLIIGIAEDEDRSEMNATIDPKDENLKADFDKTWKEAGISSLNGHRDVG